MASGYIYCFSNESMSDVYKIGHTTRSPIMRLKDDNSSDTWRPPNLYKLEFAKLVENCKEKETMVHNLLEKCNSRISSNREFFRTSLDNIKDIFDRMDGEWYDKALDSEYKQDVLEKKLLNNDVTNKTKNITPTVISTTDQENNAITCSVCSKIYKNLITYNKHISLNRCHVKVIDNICKYCNNVFKTKQNKQKHELRCSANKTGKIEANMKIISKAISEIKSISGALTADLDLYSNNQL